MDHIQYWLSGVTAYLNVPASKQIKKTTNHARM
jgi:hypothetical protein